MKRAKRSPSSLHRREHFVGDVRIHGRTIGDVVASAGVFDQDGDAALVHATLIPP